MKIQTESTWKCISNLLGQLALPQEYIDQAVIAQRGPGL